MLKKIISFLIVVFVCTLSVLTVFAHNRNKHDEDIEYVLFGNKDYKNTHPGNNNTIIQAIEDAAYLCIDQFNGHGEKELNNLNNNEKIPGIVQSIDEIDFPGNSTHRYYTHRGWNITYTDKEDKAHWPKRKEILFKTVETKLFSRDKPNTFVQKLSKLFYGENDNTKQCESFCVLLYYIHILGDHIEAGEKNASGGEKSLKEKTNSLSHIAPLAHTNDRDNPGIIPDLIKYCAILFQDQSNTTRYQSLMLDLQELSDESEMIYESTGGVNTEEKFEKYNKCATELLDKLSEHVSELLKNEAFFADVFYK